MNKRHYEHTLPNIRGSLSNTYLPPPAGQLKGSGLQELANELIVKFNL